MNHSLVPHDNLYAFILGKDCMVLLTAVEKARSRSNARIQEISKTYNIWIPPFYSLGKKKSFFKFFFQQLLM